MANTGVSINRVRQSKNKQAVARHKAAIIRGQQRGATNPPPPPHIIKTPKGPRPPAPPILTKYLQKVLVQAHQPQWYIGVGRYYTMPIQSVGYIVGPTADPNIVQVWVRPPTKKGGQPPPGYMVQAAIQYTGLTQYTVIKYLNSPPPRPLGGLPPPKQKAPPKQPTPTPPGPKKAPRTMAQTKQSRAKTKAHNAKVRPQPPKAPRPKPPKAPTGAGVGLPIMYIWYIKPTHHNPSKGKSTMQTQNTNPTPANVATPTQTPATPAMGGALGQMALYAKAQAQKAAQQAQRLANATYTLVRPSNANLNRTPAGGKTQAQTNAQYAAAILLQVYPLIANSGLTPAQQTQVQHNLLQSIYILQGAANLPTNKQAVQMHLGQPNP
jgi:hypothetical protein